MRIIYDKEKQKLPIYSWCENPEQGAIDQAINLSNLPFAYHHISLMPDCHQGYGMPIGGVLATKSVIVPNAVGVDIGCGMRAMRTNIQDIQIDDLKEIMGEIRKVIPVGFNHRREKSKWSGFDDAPDIEIIQKELQSAMYQIGTLGGGNHFIEIQKGSDGYIWIMIHSGSRNFGYKIAKEYNQKATDLCNKWYSNIPEIKGEDGLAFLPEDTNEAQEYIKAMNFALEFACANRYYIMDSIITVFDWKYKSSFKIFETIDIHHNYAIKENHYGQNVWIHRKGATLAREKTIGIIPGSQGTNSYIVEGLGNKKSFDSCSHGAGRAMGRNQARNNLSLQDEIKKLDDKGIVHSIRNQKDLDEAAGAYKDIKTVMEEQKDLVKILVELTPLGIIKG